MKLRLATIAATVLLLTGCSAPAAEVAARTPSAAVTPTPTWTPEPWPSSIPSIVEVPDEVTPPVDNEPTYEDEIFLAALGTIDPGLAHERSLGRAANVCLDIEQGKDSAAVLAGMEARFEGGTVPDLSGGQLAALLRLIRTTCH
jgi:hypothetical protein